MRVCSFLLLFFFLREVLNSVFLDRQHPKEEICIKVNDMHGLDMKMLHTQAHGYKKKAKKWKNKKIHTDLI